MSASLRIASGADAARTRTLVAARLAEQTGAEQVDAEPGKAEDAIVAALAPLLAGMPGAVLYLIGPPNAPVGYALVTFGYALSPAGPTATIGDLFIRQGIRGRGMGSEAVRALGGALGQHGIVTLNLDIPTDNPRARVFGRRLGFAQCDGRSIMSRPV